jgi:hypothetical protein
MRALTIGLLAATCLGVAMPASAQDVSIGVGVRDHDRDRDHDRRRVVIREREHMHHCRVIVIHRDGMTKRIKRCG